MLLDFVVYIKPFPSSTLATQERSQELQLSVNNLISALTEVDDWETLGLKLDVTWSIIKQIAKNRNNKESHLCKADLFDHWLKSATDASWEKVVTALEEMNSQVIASEIKNTYCC